MAKIDTALIEGYDAMIPEQKLAALEAFEYDDHSGELEKLKNAVTKATGEAAELKRKYKAQLTEDEQKQQEAAEATEKIMKELETLRRDKTISDHKASYLSLGYDDALATETAIALADGDLAKVFANQQKFNTEMAKTMKAEALKNTPRPGVGSGNGMDYDKLIAEAQKSGRIAEVAYYNRLKAQAAQRADE